MMNNTKFLPWLFIVVGGWGLASGVLMNDMGGLASLGANPDMPVSLGLSPGRFMLGLLINGGLLAGGISMLMKAAKPEP